ncbi:MAG: hypothetical protein U9Q95_04810, partial [Candidatus Eisenbacteria bacterium]|nr:hypothetical protein [Candidatus Eisenbacteria bacterium]
SVAPQATMSVVLRSSPRIFRESVLLPYELLPNAESAHSTAEFSVPIRINSLGYRGDEFDPRKREQFRILVVGDSFTFGHGCTAEETYVSVLERALTEAVPVGRDVQVINAGYAACNSPDTYYLYLKKIGLLLEPDLVIVGFFIGNDLDRQGKSLHRWVDVDPEGLPLKISGTSAHVEDGYWVANHRADRYRLPVVRDSHLAQAVISAISSVRRGDAGRAPIYNELIYLENYLERTGVIRDMVQRLFSATRISVEEHGARLVVVMIPAYEQVRPDLVFGDSGLDSGLDLLKPQREFARFFGKQDIDYVDLLPDLRELATTEELYLPYDHHWTVRGNEIVGALLASRLLATGAVETTKRL